MTILLFLGVLLWPQMGWGQGVQGGCGRTVFIGHKEILLDTGSKQKGEGLRSYLAKDSKALHYLNLYQKGHATGPLNTFFAALAPSLFLAGFMVDSNSRQQKTLYTWGAVLILANFLISKTLQSANEGHLERAIEEYNKRQVPKIRYGGGPLQKRFSFIIKRSWNF